MAKTSRRASRILAKERKLALRQKKNGSGQLRRRMRAGAAALVLLGVGTVSVVRSSDPPADRTISDLSKQEIVALADAARARLRTEASALGALRPRVDRDAASAKARQRLEVMHTDYLDFLRSKPAGLDADMVEIAERIPLRPGTDARPPQVVKEWQGDSSND